MFDPQYARDINAGSILSDPALMYLPADLTAVGQRLPPPHPPPPVGGGGSLPGGGALRYPIRAASAAEANAAVEAEVARFVAAGDAVESGLLTGTGAGTALGLAAAWQLTTRGPVGRPIVRFMYYPDQEDEVSLDGSPSDPE
eukprot:tig00000681_g3124.t1